MNLLLNSQFKGASYGTNTINLSTGGGAFFVDRWRGKYHETSSSANMKQLDTYDGGVKLTLTTTSNPDYFYFRQSIPGIEQFSGKTYTLRVRTGFISADMKYDVYINARFNSNDAQRANQVDSGQVDLASDSVITYTFTVEDLSVYGYTKDDMNSLELAFRVYAPAGKTAKVNEIKSIALYEGSEDLGEPYTDVTYERAVYDQYHEVSSFLSSVGGLSDSSGQKRAFFPFTAKQRKGCDYSLTTKDAAGNSGKVSTYSFTGARTDGVTPTAISKCDNGFTVILNGSSVSGIACLYEVSSED